MRSILDYQVVQPGCEDFGAERTLRDLIFMYYDDRIDDEKRALKYAQEYCRQIEEKEKNV